MPKVVIPVLFAAIVFCGCSKKTPCESLAAAVCKGGETEECANVRRQARDADENRQSLCQQLSLVIPAPAKTPNSCDQLANMVCSERPLEDCLNMRREAVGADDNKIKICAQFKTLIENTRKANAEKADAERAAMAKSAEAASETK